MYLASASPILPGDQERAARKLASSAARRNDAAVQSVMGRLALWQTITSPSDLAQMFGAQLGANAAMMQDATSVSRSASLVDTTNPALPATDSQSVQEIIAAAPRSYSLNGQPSQVDGCKWAPAPDMSLVPLPSPTMPALAPVTVQTPLGPASMPPGTQPRYSNLCWALRNGLVAQSQFSPDDLRKLAMTCANLGYSGSCPPPADVASWLAQQARAGTLPHIAVSDADLAVIPHAPNLTGLSCPQAMIAGGLTGYAPSWSDALVSDYQSGASGPDTGVVGWIQAHPWLSLALAVGGAVALSRRAR